MLADKPGQYSASHLVQVITFILALLVIAALLACAVDWILSWSEPRGGTLRNNPIWFDLLDGELRPPKAKAVVAAVELKNGGTILGALMGHEPKPDKTLAWLVLTSHPAASLAVRRPDGTQEPMGEGWQYVFIAGDDIRSVSTAFSSKIN